VQFFQFGQMRDSAPDLTFRILASWAWVGKQAKVTGLCRSHRNTADSCYSGFEPTRLRGWPRTGMPCSGIMCDPRGGNHGKALHSILDAQNTCGEPNDSANDASEQSYKRAYQCPKPKPYAPAQVANASCFRGSACLGAIFKLQKAMRPFTLGSTRSDKHGMNAIRPEIGRTVLHARGLHSVTSMARDGLIGFGQRKAQAGPRTARFAGRSGGPRYVSLSGLGSGVALVNDGRLCHSTIHEQGCSASPRSSSGSRRAAPAFARNARQVVGIDADVGPRTMRASLMSEQAFFGRCDNHLAGGTERERRGLPV